MMVDLIALGDYLSPVDPDLWVWDEKGETVQWASGTTIGFREEFAAILSQVETTELGASWLPPFGAIVLLVAACRDEPAGWEEVNPRRDDDYSYSDVEMTVLMCHLRRIDFRGNLISLLHQLKKVHRLPAECRTSLKAKAAMAAEIFSASKFRVRPAPGGDFLPSLRRGKFKPALAHLSVAALAQALSTFEVETWPTRFQIGIDEPPAPAEEIELPETNPPTGETVRKLIDTLREDGEFAAMAAVARDLLAVAHLPRPVSLREELPIGGVSDISNRGSLQHLLIAELANDDFTLAMRIAQGEALYLRREDPPLPPPGDRILVLDGGLRMWGTPRVFGVSVGLALAATTANRGEWKAFRAEGSEAVAIDLGSRAGLVDHLSRLSPHLSPLNAFQKIYEEATTEAVREVVLITSEDAAADPAFTANLPKERGPTLYVASVNRTGEFKLREPRRRGLEPLRIAQLDVGALATPRKPLLTPSMERLPPIFSTTPFPLLLPHQFPGDGGVVHPKGGIVALVGDGRLLYWPKPQGWGGVELASKTGKGGVRLLTVFPDGAVSVVRYRNAQEPMTLFTIKANGESFHADLGVFEGTRPTVFRRGPTIFVATESKIQGFDPWTGRREGDKGFPSTPTFSRFGFVRYRDHWHYPVISDGKVLFPHVFDQKAEQFEAAVDLFQMPGTEDIYALLPNWNIVPILDPDKAILFPRIDASYATELVHVSPTGNFLLIRTASKFFILDVKNRASRLVPPGKQIDDLPRPSAPSYRTRVQGIGFDGLKRPVLGVPGGRIKVSLYENQLYWTYPIAASEEPLHKFPSLPEREWDGRSLRRVVLPGGREVILDKRGLLHFFDPSGKLPDVAITLFTNNANAAWSSRLGSVGNQYCFGDRIPYPNDWAPFMDAIARYAEGT
jgi:hypothetical protein